jgi:hypothetical protein
MRRIEIFFCHILRQVVWRDSGVVDQDVEFAEMNRCLIDCRRNLIQFGHIHLQSQCFLPEFLDIGFKIAAGIHVPKPQRNVCAGVRQSKRYRSPQAACGAGHQCDPALQIDRGKSSMLKTLPAT